jgi:hypothetical protein
MVVRADEAETVHHRMEKTMFQTMWYQTQRKVDGK